MSVNSSSTTKWVRLGDYIEEFDVRNFDNKIKKVKSVSVSKEFKETNAKVNKEELQGYKLVPPYHLSYVQTTKNEKCFANALNTTNETYVVTQVNKVFFVKIPEVLNIEYLSLIFKGDEFDRYAIFNSWGSARETFDWSVLCDTLIPLPEPDIQQELVDTYNGLKALAEQNEALIKPLTEACQAYIVDCKKKYPEVELGGYIEEYDVRNSDKKIRAVKSVSVTKEFKETGAKVNKDELEGYKIVPPNHLSYVQTTKNEKCFANALNTTNETYVVTQVNKVIFSKDASVLNIGYLHIIFRSEEFDRYAIFNSWGSARETFDWSELCKVLIPLPPPEVQQAIVDIYNCAEEAKKIANDAREKMKNLCPALVQRAING